MSPKSGIYEIVNVTNDKRYVGSAVNLSKRKTKHWSLLRLKEHYNRYLQNTWNKYGEDAFRFNILFYCDPRLLITFEQRAIDYFDPEYNIAKNAGNSLGVKHTAETRAKKSKMMLGNQRSLGHKLGHKCTEETKAKLSKAAMGNQNSLGHKHTEETKAKISKAHKGKKRSEEHKANISKARKGKPWSINRRLAQTKKKK